MGVYRCIIAIFFFNTGDSVISSRDAHDDVTFCVIRLATDKEGQSICKGSEKKRKKEGGKFFFLDSLR